MEENGTHPIRSNGPKFEEVARSTGWTTTHQETRNKTGQVYITTCFQESCMARKQRSGPHSTESMRDIRGSFKMEPGSLVFQNNVLSCCIFSMYSLNHAVTYGVNCCPPTKFTGLR